MAGAIVVELTGSTGAGKSTVARWLLEDASARGQPIRAADQVVCGLYGLRPDWLPGRVARSILLDVLTFPWFVAFVLRQPSLWWFIIRVAWRDIDLPLFRLNVLRNSAKHLGAYQLVRSHALDGEIVVFDEGPVHAAHGLFVHPCGDPRPEDVARFMRDVPVPDLLVLVEGITSEVVTRTAQRGHGRLPGGGIAEVAPFVRRAEIVLSRVTQVAGGRTATLLVRNTRPDSGVASGSSSAILTRAEQLRRDRAAVPRPPAARPQAMGISKA